MKRPDLSVLIPARNEMWLGKTVADVVEHVEADTEVIVVLDGAWPMQPLEQHPRVTVVYLPKSIGQRAATNLAARLSTAKFVMKLDAHCSVDQGFDKKLIQAASELDRTVTQVPAQYNLHVFNWVCETCGDVTYQGPTPLACGKCQAKSPDGVTSTHRRDVLWQKRHRRITRCWRFDKNLHFQYWGAREKHPDSRGELIETMSCLGAAWFLERERYWELGGLDEKHGSWGQMGTEIACKSWLSGGRLVTNKRTWFAHLFRTQGGDFGFPYPMAGKDQEYAREYSKALWLKNAWPGQARSLSWLIGHFSPVPDWEVASGK